ncbi:polysaccharide lyase family 7 protein [Mangrovivirga cuniculi]|uniref:polysaccharide lyase family 7 protein n=1 Tax=Mangrovivirga cuniculi TaxID=2715131 RepID=UPI001C2F8FAE|nr:polysaccharide lyase family 7 protein [Mangrovivirga cuniculi]
MRYLIAILLITCASCVSCQTSQETPTPVVIEKPSTNYKLPDIDLSNWKVTLPIGRPTEVKPPEILDYATNETLKPFMYNDSTDGSLVFYTYPGATTTNTSYSRTELREQMEPGSNSVNWTFKQGGRMRGTLSVPEISTNSDGKKDRTIIMQIHGRLTNEQRDLIGEDDNNAPPILKIYWANDKIRVKSKVLKNTEATYEELLHTSAWGMTKVSTLMKWSVMKNSPLKLSHQKEEWKSH